MLPDHLFAGLRMKAARGEIMSVWKIGAWNLEIVCYLSFGACNFAKFE
jgi:hypothetical protein